MAEHLPCEVLTAALRWSLREFGEDASRRYRAFLAQAIQDISEDPGVSFTMLATCSGALAGTTAQRKGRNDRPPRREALRLLTERDERMELRKSELRRKIAAALGSLGHNEGIDGFGPSPAGRKPATQAAKRAATIPLYCFVST